MGFKEEITLNGWTLRFSRLAHYVDKQTKKHFKFSLRLGKLYDWKPSYWNYALVGGVGSILNWLFFVSFRSVLGDLAWWLGLFIAWNSNYFLSKMWVFKSD